MEVVSYVNTLSEYQPYNPHNEVGFYRIGMNFNYASGKRKKSQWIGNKNYVPPKWEDNNFFQLSLLDYFNSPSLFNVHVKDIDFLKSKYNEEQLPIKRYVAKVKKETIERSVKNTKRRVREIVYCNYLKRRTSFLTLTVDSKKSEAGTNPLKLKKLFKKFANELAKKYGIVILGIMEKQNAKGELFCHYHCLLFNAPFVTFEELNTMWCWGYTEIKQVNWKNKNHCVSYIMKYISKGVLANYERGKSRYFASRGRKQKETIYRNQVSMRFPVPSKKIDMKKVIEVYRACLKRNKIPIQLFTCEEHRYVVIDLELDVERTPILFDILEKTPDKLIQTYLSDIPYFVDMI